MYTVFFWNILMVLIIVIVIIIIIIILNQRKFLLLIHSFYILSTRRREVLRFLALIKYGLCHSCNQTVNCLRRFVFFSWKHRSDDNSLPCDVWVPHRGWRPIFPCLQRMLFSMYWNLRQTDFKAPCWKSVGLWYGSESKISAVLSRRVVVSMPVSVLDSWNQWSLSTLTLLLCAA